MFRLLGTGESHISPGIHVSDRSHIGVGPVDIIPAIPPVESPLSVAVRIQRAAIDQGVNNGSSPTDKDICCTKHVK